MASPFRNLRIITRHNWEYFTTRRDTATFTEKRFPQDYLVNDYGKRDATGSLLIFSHTPGDIENASIKEVVLYKKNGGTEHELLFVTVEYHGETIAYGITERSWARDGRFTYEPPCYQSPISHLPQKSNIIGDSDTTMQPQLDTYTTNDAVYFRSTRARAEMATLHSTSQCTFTPDPNSLRYSLIKFLIICDSFTIASQKYPPLSTNSYYYTAIILKLLEDFIGGQTVYRKNNTIGKKKGVTIVGSDDDMVSQVVQETKQLFLTEWAEFEADRSRLNERLKKAARWDQFQAGTSVDTPTVQAGREDADDNASARPCRTEAGGDDTEMASPQATDQAATQALADYLGVSLSEAGETLEKVKCQVREERMGQERSALDS